MKNIWNRHKGKIIAVVIVAAVLIGAFFWGGNFSKNTSAEANIPASAPSPSASAPSASFSIPAPSGNVSGSGAAADDHVSKSGPEEENTPVTPGLIVSGSGTSDSATDGPESDKNQASPVPSGKPEPVEAQSAVIGDTKLTCTLSVSCSTILNNMELLEKDKQALVPVDGVIFANKTVTFYEGESVFNVLQREMKKAGIQMEFKNTPMYNSAYIEGINNLYEFDVGDLSGWEYEVNGWFPNYGCSRYQLRDGDVVSWLYTCDLGKDVGGNNSTGS